MGLKDALKDIMPTGAEVKEQVVKEVGDAKSFLGNVLSDIGAEMVEQVKHGSHELAAALLGQTDGFVMYPHEGKPPEHGLPPAASKDQEQQKEQERGGMEM